jgi:hypothetical protein
MSDLKAFRKEIDTKASEMAAKKQKVLPYSLVNVEARAHDYPGEFLIPPKEDRVNLSPGDTVKLIFSYSFPGAPTERMWVQVTKVIRPGVYDGKLDSQSLVLKQGIPVRFSREHVAAIYQP